MTLTKNLVPYLKSFNFTHWERILAWLLTLKHDVQSDFGVDEDDFMILLKNKIIQRDYSSNKFVVLIPIYDEDGDIQYTNENDDIKESVKEHVDKFRVLFKGVRLGSQAEKNTVTMLLTDWLLNNKQYSMKDVVEKTQGFINYMREEGKGAFIQNADNFIYSSKTDRSTLTIIMEEDFDNASVMV